MKNIGRTKAEVGRNNHVFTVGWNYGSGKDLKEIASFPPFERFLDQAWMAMDGYQPYLLGFKNAAPNEKRVF